jgi:hypothetical protein
VIRNTTKVASDCEGRGSIGSIESLCRSRLFVIGLLARDGQGAQIPLELRPVLAEVVQQSRHVGRVRQRRVAGPGRLHTIASKLSHLFQVFPQRLPVVVVGRR